MSRSHKQRTFSTSPRAYICLAVLLESQMGSISASPSGCGAGCEEAGSDEDIVVHVQDTLSLPKSRYQSSSSGAPFEDNAKDIAL